MSEDENVIWHYTKMDVLKKIFKDKDIKREKYKKAEKGNIELRFTHSRFTNDPSESLILRKFLETNKNTILGNLDENIRNEVKKCQEINYYEKVFDNDCDNLGNDCYPFILSTTHSKDSFTFWSKDYAGLDGVAIGINEEIFKQQLKENNKCHRMLDVIYIDPLSNDMVKSINEKINDIYDYNYVKYKDAYPKFDILYTLLFYYSSLYKHKSWECEKEVRVILQKDKIDVKIEFYENKIIPVCYESFNEDVVNSIMLGPGSNEKAQKAIDMFLKDRGYDNINVSRSTAFDL